MSNEEQKTDKVRGFLSQAESFFQNITSSLKDGIAKKKLEKKQNEMKYDIGVDDIQAAYGNVPKKIGVFTIGLGLVIILIMTVMTVREQVSQVDANRTVVDDKLLKEGDVQISIDEQGWKYYQSKRIDMVTESTKKELNATKEEMKKNSKELQESVRNDLNQTVQSVRGFVDSIGVKLEDMKLDISKQLTQQMNKVDSKVKENEEFVKNMKNHNTNTPSLDGNLKLLPPPLSGLSTTNVNQKVIVKKEVEIVYIEPDSEGYDYMNVKIDSVDVKMEEISTALYIEESNTSSTTTKFHFMKGLVKATLLTGVSAPTFGGGGGNNPAPVLLSVDGSTIIANDENEVIENCLVSGSATGNINTAKADILLTEISCSGYNKKGKRIKIEQPIKGWVIGEDGSFGLAGRLLDSSGKVITKMIALEVIKSLSATLVASVQPAGSILGTGTAAIPYDQAAKGGLGTGVSNGLDKALEHYDQILTGMYPTISVRAGKKISILLKGGEDAIPVVYDSIDINNEFEVE